MPNYLDNAENDVRTYFETHEIPRYFYQCLFAELIKIFGINFLIPDENYLAEYDDDGNMLPSNNDNYSYKDQISYYLALRGGTFGWGNAFAQSCKECELPWLQQDYENMECALVMDCIDQLIGCRCPNHMKL